MPPPSPPPNPGIFPPELVRLLLRALHLLIQALSWWLADRPSLPPGSPSEKVAKGDKP